MQAERDRTFGSPPGAGWRENVDLAALPAADAEHLGRGECGEHAARTGMDARDPALLGSAERTVVQHDGKSGSLPAARS
jgi:hypothetical protein